MDNDPKKIIVELFAFCSQDEVDGQEGIIGCMSDDGQWFPLIGADMERVESIRNKAIQIGKLSGKKIVLKKFLLVGDPEVIFDNS